MDFENRKDEIKAFLARLEGIWLRIPDTSLPNLIAGAVWHETGVVKYDRREEPKGFYATFLSMDEPLLLRRIGDTVEWMLESRAGDEPIPFTPSIDVKETKGWERAFVIHPECGGLYHNLELPQDREFLLTLLDGEYGARPDLWGIDCIKECRCVGQDRIDGIRWSLDRLGSLWLRCAKVDFVEFVVAVIKTTGQDDPEYFSDNLMYLLEPNTLGYFEHVLELTE